MMTISEYSGKFGDILIKRGACVGTQTMILPGKTIGEKSHVAAGVSLLTMFGYGKSCWCAARIIKNFKE